MESIKHLEFLNQNEKAFLKELGDSPSTDSYKDWKRNEEKLNEIYKFIVSGGLTFTHECIVREGFIHPSTSEHDCYQFTMFDSDVQPIGHFTEQSYETLSRRILSYGYLPSKIVLILH